MHAPDAGALDVAAIRRSWQQLLDRLGDERQPVLRASLESVTPASYDGTTLELAFPPGKRFAVEKVRSKEEDLRRVFADIFGISPRFRCEVRESAGGDVVDVVDEEPPATAEDVVARLKAEFGAVEESS
jgi:hypothetical protein